MNSIQQEAQVLWNDLSVKLSGDNFLSAYLNQTPLKEVKTTFDITSRQYTMLMVINSNLREVA